MKNFEPTDHKIKKDKEKGNLLKFDLLETFIFFSCATSTILIWNKNFFYSFSLFRALFGGLLGIGVSCIILILVRIIINKGVWIKRENKFEFGSNFKTFFKGFRKALLIGIFVVAYLVLVFNSVSDLSSLLKKVLSLGTLLLVLILVFEVIIESIMYRKSLMMDAKELKDEQKELEGDPLIKSAIKQAHKVMLYEEVVARIRSCKYIVVG